MHQPKASMKAFVAGAVLVLVATGSLLTGADGFVLLAHDTTTATSTARSVGGGPAAREARGVFPPTRPSQNAATASPVASKTALFAKATYASFEDMLEKEAGPLLVDFYATWCGPCKMMGETLKEVGPKMSGEVKVMKIDSDKYPSLTEKFAVAGLPTLILFKDGRELHRMEGLLPANQLMEQVRYYLQGADVGHGGAHVQEQGGACPSPTSQDACVPPTAVANDACAPPPQDACAPPKRDACAPPSP